MSFSVFFPYLHHGHRIDPARNPRSKMKGFPHGIGIQTRNFANLTLSQDCHNQRDHRCAKSFWIEREKREKEKKLNSPHINFI
jgi:hypothetical protein